MIFIGDLADEHTMPLYMFAVFESPRLFRRTVQHVPFSTSRSLGCRAAPRALVLVQHEKWSFKENSQSSERID